MTTDRTVAAPIGPLYAAVGLGAFLLFLVEPMSARFILPWFGGGPTVWSTCLLFFQVALLAGYGYAHLSRRLPLARQAQLHMVLLLFAVLALPILPSPAWKPVDAAAPGAHILLLLTVMLGLPYFVLAATAPLMQDWFARGGATGTPYRLYAWSNLGSLIALLAYPLLVEPFLPLRAQAMVWSTAFVAFCVVCGWSAFGLIRIARADGGGVDIPRQDASVEPPAQPGDSVMWVTLSACGSGLLLAVTNQLCQNVAVVPLLWILPLTGYLITFILCFGGAYRRAVWGPLLVVALGAAAWIAKRDPDMILPQFGAAIGILFAGCMACHGELVRSRPDARRLTAFYLAIAAGGSLGGLSVALLAPAVLDRLWEFPFFAVLSLALFMIALYRDPASRLRGGARPAVWLGLSAVVCLAIAGFVQAARADVEGEIARTRNFYGILSVADDGPDTGDPPMRRLRNGRILHGAQFLDPAQKMMAGTYYGPGSGIAIAILQHPQRQAGRPLHVGVVGLGAGTIAAWGETGDTFRFFEINSAAERVARQYFTFLADSRASVSVAIGDARLTLERGLHDGTGAGTYDVLAIDAFSGDAIPVHLLTREAFALYAAAMRPDGVLAVHVSNHYLDLMPIVRGLAREQGRQVLEIERDDDASLGIDASTWMLVTGSDAFLANARSMAAVPTAGARSLVWTDAFSSLLPVVKW